MLIIFVKLQGDSGGPLHKVMEDGRMKQIGITSFGLAFGCELGFHGAFTRTSKYRRHQILTTWQHLNYDLARVAQLVERQAFNITWARVNQN